MYDLKVCTVCLQKNVKIYNLDRDQLRKDFNLISGLKTHSGNGLPEYLCFQCVAYVKSCKKFRDKCQRAYFALQEILHRNKEITKSVIDNLDCNALKIGPSLSYLDTNIVRTKFDNVKFKWMKTLRMNVEPQENIPVIHYGSSDVDTFEAATTKAILETVKDENADNMGSQDHDYGETNAVLNVEGNAENVYNNEFDAYSDKDFDNNDIETKGDADVDGNKLDEEYATMVPITLKEAHAVVDVCKLLSSGKNQCIVCGRSYNSIQRLKVHMRMHEKHVSGTHLCILCNYYYKTEFLLKTHMTDKHMYKYLCRKCPEVTYDRTSAKQHYIWSHLQKGSKKNVNWYKTRPKWLSSKGLKKEKLYVRPVKRSTKLPKDFPVYSPISQEEQYALVHERKNTKNYIESRFKCQHCFKGFREAMTFTKHLKKHDPNVSGNLQCDMCKIYCTNSRKMYKHMNMSHLFKYSCQQCSYVCFNRGQAKMHYRWHKNVTYSCPHCGKVFTKASTRLTHIRIKHPSMFICNLCGHSFVSENGLYCHKKLAHSVQEVESTSGAVDTSHRLYCRECGIQFVDDGAFATHFGSSNKHADTNLSIKPIRSKSERPRGRPRRDNSDIVNTGVPTASNCEICKKYLPTDKQARRHYESEHPGTEFLKRYMCDICGHTTKQYANLTVHMRTHTLEKPYACPHCERRFSMPSNRDRHLVVHTGEKRYQCQHCNRRFTQSSAVKLHIQTVHMKIPYAPWDKKNRKRRREMEVAPLPPPAPTHKLVLDTANYLSAYITYNE